MENKKISICVLLGMVLFLHVVCAMGDLAPITAQNFLYAVQGRNIDAIKTYLAQEGRDINAVDKNGNTALHLAVNKPSEGVVKLLVDAGIDVNKKNNDKKTALVIAAEKLYALEQQAKEVKDPTKITDRSIKYTNKLLAAKPYENIIKLLLAHNADAKDAQFQPLVAKSSRIKNLLNNERTMREGI